MRRATSLSIFRQAPAFYFYPRSPCGERRRSNQSVISQTNNFYPRSPCGERRLPTALRTPHQRFLSTLSLRRATGGSGVGSWPRGIFLSTLSLRRATARRDSRQQPAGISIHALLAESDVNTADQEARKRLISIHALLAESDMGLDGRFKL